MNPLIQLLIGQAPEIIAAIGGVIHKAKPDAPAPSSTEVIAVFDQLLKDSGARNAFLIKALEAEIAALKPNAA